MWSTHKKIVFACFLNLVAVLERSIAFWISIVVNSRMWSICSMLEEYSFLEWSRNPEDGSGGPVRVVDLAESDDDFDSVIDALHRDSGGHVVPQAPLTHEDEDMLESTPLGAPRVLGPEVDPIAVRRPRRLVLVQGPQVAKAEMAVTPDVEPEEGSVISMGGEEVEATISEPDIVMQEVRETRQEAYEMHFACWSPRTSRRCSRPEQTC